MPCDDSEADVSTLRRSWRKRSASDAWQVTGIMSVRVVWWPGMAGESKMTMRTTAEKRGGKYGHGI